MITNVIQFPADRCRRPASAVELTEREAYAHAATEAAAMGGFRGPSICTMMTLALEGVCAITGAKAAAWLHQHHAILIR